MWSVSWYLLVTNNPEEHPSISSEEVALILQGQNAKTPRAQVVPWGLFLSGAGILGVALRPFLYDWDLVHIF